MLWLDDQRPAPPGWTAVSTSAECIEALESSPVEVLSLDHDLGGDDTGYKVVLWLELRAADGLPVPGDIRVHSANPVGAARMLAGLESVRRLSSLRL